MNEAHGTPSICDQNKYLRYYSLIENLPEGLVAVDLDENITLANPAAERIFSIEPGQLVGRNLRDFLDRGALPILLEQANLRREGISNAYKLTITRLDSEQRNLVLTVSPEYDDEGNFTGSCGLIQDITNKKAVEAAVAQSIRLTENLRISNSDLVIATNKQKLIGNQLRILSRAIEQTQSTVVITDSEGTIEYVNPKFFETTGFLIEEVLGQNARIQKSSKHPPESYAEMWKQLASGKVSLSTRRRMGNCFGNRQ